MKEETPLTKEYFEELFDRKFGEKFSALGSIFATREYLDEKIDALAIATAKGFAEADENIKGIKLDIYETECRLASKIAGVDDRLKTVEAHIGKIEIRYANLNEMAMDHSKRLREVEMKFAI